MASPSLSPASTTETRTCSWCRPRVARHDVSLGIPIPTSRSAGAPTAARCCSAPRGTATRASASCSLPRSRAASKSGCRCRLRTKAASRPMPSGSRMCRCRAPSACGSAIAGVRPRRSGLPRCRTAGSRACRARTRTTSRRCGLATPSTSSAIAPERSRCSLTTRSRRESRKPLPTRGWTSSRPRRGPAPSWWSRWGAFFCTT